MRALGFQFATNHDAGGVIVALIGFRMHHSVVDIVLLHGEHDAVATRIPGDETDILAPRKITWRVTGSATNVIDSLLELTDPVREEWNVPATSAGD